MDKENAADRISMFLLVFARFSANRHPYTLGRQTIDSAIAEPEDGWPLPNLYRSQFERSQPPVFTSLSALPWDYQQ